MWKVVLNDTFILDLSKNFTQVNSLLMDYKTQKDRVLDFKEFTVSKCLITSADY